MARETHPTAEVRPQSSGDTDKAEQAKQKAEHAAREAKEQAVQLADKAREQARTQLAGQKDRATDHLGSIGSALRETSSNLRERDEGAVAGYVDEAAHQVDRLSDYLRRRTVGDLIHEAQGLARRDPALFLGGAALLGLVGARFFKSSEPQHGYTSSRGGASHYERGRDYESRYEYREGSRGDYDRGDHDRGDYDRRTVYRERPRADLRQYDEGRSNVHGTAGGEMPDPSRGASRPASQDRPATGAPEAAAGPRMTRDREGEQRREA